MRLTFARPAVGAQGEAGAAPAHPSLVAAAEQTDVRTASTLAVGVGFTRMTLYCRQAERERDRERERERDCVCVC